MRDGENSKPIFGIADLPVRMSVVVDVKEIENTITKVQEVNAKRKGTNEVLRCKIMFLV